MLCRAFHSASQRSRYFSVTISRIGPDVLRHAAVDQHQAVLQLAAGLRRGVALVQDAVLRHQPAAADAELRVALAGEHAFDQLHAGPDAARVLPAAAGAAEPFAEQRARQHQPALVLLQLAGQRGRLAGGAHADADQRGQQVRGDRQARALGDVVHVADDLQPAARPDHARQQLGQALARAFDARRHDAGGDHRRLEQARGSPSRNRTPRPGS